jgi:homopolymeric O-antigen transport system permease protein
MHATDAPIRELPRSIVIRPPSGWTSLGMRELAEYRELLYFLTKRELQIRYKQSFFGVGWAILQPVALAFIFTIFFGILANVPSNGLPYPVFALAALAPWLFVSQTVGQAALSLVGDANLLSKVYFPRLVIPLAKTFALVVDLVIALAVVVVMAALYGHPPHVEILVLPAFLLLGFVTGAGMGILLAAVNVQYRDVSMAVPLLMQTWLFATPVIYPGSLVEGAWKYVYALNPMTSVVEGCRWALLGAPVPELVPVLISVAVAISLLVGGLVYFRRTELFFADVV